MDLNEKLEMAQTIIDHEIDALGIAERSKKEILRELKQLRVKAYLEDIEYDETILIDEWEEITEQRYPTPDPMASWENNGFSGPSDYGRYKNG